MTQVQILDESVGISHYVNYLWEKYEWNYSPSNYGQLVGQSEIFNVAMATSLEGKLWYSNLLNSL